jgi:hypothetical protein
LSFIDWLFLTSAKKEPDRKGEVTGTVPENVIRSGHSKMTGFKTDPWKYTKLCAASHHGTFTRSRAFGFLREQTGTPAGKYPATAI